MAAMRGRPSQTASAVGVMRALAHEGFTSAQGFSDGVVGSLLSPGWRAAHRLAARGLERARPSVRARAIARIDLLPLRVLAIDAELERAVAAGCRQLVILGAGLDTRAFRLASLSSVDVFEVDHPATQAYKKERTAGVRPLARSLAFVGVDFERDVIGDRLRAAGHREGEPTVWIWEGVIMYLTDAALRATLAAIAGASAPGSELLATYHEPGVRRLPQRLLLALWGEPHIGRRPVATMHAEVARAGFEVVRDTRPDAWARSFGARPPSGEAAGVNHLLVARRPAAGS
jgi:methyltransferase (TIGR00027 family)